MSKINIYFNNKNYSVDEQALSSASDSLKTHLLTRMNGSGAAIDFDGQSYNIDSTKLSTARNDFIAHLGTIAGNGGKVVVNGVEYSIDTTKLSGAISELEAVLGNLYADDDEPTMSEYGFYYNVPYVGNVPTYGEVAIVFREDGSNELLVAAGKEMDATGTYTYSQNSVGISAPWFKIQANGVFENEGEELYVAAFGTRFYANKNYECVYWKCAKGDYVYKLADVYYDKNAENGEGYTAIDPNEENYKELNWVVEPVINKTKSSYGPIEREINGQVVKTLYGTFAECENLEVAPEIPDTVEELIFTFEWCTSLVNAPVIPDSVVSMLATFMGCVSMVTAPELPANVKHIPAAFRDCDSLVNAPTIPNGVLDMRSTFIECISLVNAPVIPSSVTDISYVFNDCTNLTGDVVINANPTGFENCFYDTVKPITIKGSCSSTTKANLAATANNKNVTY